MESERKPSAVSDAGAWAMNVTSSVGIIMANKQLMSAGGYAFGFGQLDLWSLRLREFMLALLCWNALADGSDSEFELPRARRAS